MTMMATEKRRSHAKQRPELSMEWAILCLWVRTTLIKITETAAFVNDLGADSLDIVEFVMEVEKEFNITIPDDAATKLEKVGDAVKYIDEHKKN